MKTICLLNQKGGCSKTSTCFHLSGTFSRMGLRVLLIDNDPQASLTQGFFGPSATEGLDPSMTVAALYDPEGAPPIQAATRPTGVAGVDIVPGSIALTIHNRPDAGDWGDGPESLRSALAPVSEDYDLALIDCSPNLLLGSWAALVASDAVVVPLQAEDFGSQGLTPVRRAVAAVQAGANPSLRIAGYLLVMFDRRLSVHATYEEILRDAYREGVFATVVPRAKDYVEAVAHRTPVGLHRPRSAAARVMGELAVELLARVGDAAGVGRGAA